MKRLAHSSEIYYIQAADLKKQPWRDGFDDYEKSQDCAYLLINPDDSANLIGGKEFVLNANDKDFLKTIVVYYTYPAFICFLLTLIKPIKRKFSFRTHVSFRVRLHDLLEADLPRGERNEENAYQLTNKRWQIDKEVAQKRYQELREHLKNEGYDPKWPMYVMLNRKFGAKDQLLQGHHRIGICKELGIEEVNIAFSAAPATFSFLKKLIGKKH